MGTEFDLIPMLPGEEYEDAVVREYDENVFVVDDDDPEDVAANRRVVAPPPEGSFSVWRKFAVDEIAGLSNEWEIKEVDGRTEFLADSFPWAVSVFDTGASIRWLRGPKEGTPLGTLRIVDVVDLFVGTGTLFGIGDYFSWIDVDDPMRSNDPNGDVFRYEDDPIAYYDRVVAEHEKLNNPASRDLVARALFYKGLHCRSLDMLEEAALAFAFLIVRCGRVADSIQRARVILSFIHQAEMLEMRGESGRAAEYHSLLADYRRPEDDRTLRRLAVSASSGLAQTLGVA